ncbi:DNA mismatch repair protein MutS [Candidatus Gracilibacteria bacterium]|nr:DNA mismatch repair protein MutS [Candidatus Gracilibacteria bacterium]
MQDLKDIISLIENSISQDSQNLLTMGGIIKNGFDREVDELRDFINNSNEWLNNYNEKLIDKTSISSLKIKYTTQNGYFIEIPLSQKDKAIDEFRLITTLVNNLRYTTQELDEFNKKISSAESILYKKEYDIFKEVSSQILKSFNEIKSHSNIITKIDFITNLSFVALENNYSKPEITQNQELKIVSGRHPIVEKLEKNFISNELFLDSKNYINIISGPNMGGKSTYLRQNALIILLSHTGSFVPAKSAKIPITDKIFSRIGASDNQVLGSSTFMVEMQEVSNILSNATSKSFVIIDEVGRGTSTYDGMSLAWAILKELNDKIKCKTLLSTHYHELIGESKKLSGVKNFSVAISENDDNIIFLRKVVPGGISRSYGLEVAKLAGLPKNVLDEAKDFLKKFENHKNFSQLSLGNLEVIEHEKIVYKENKALEKLKKIDVNTLTPIEALNILSELKKEA